MAKRFLTLSEIKAQLPSIPTWIPKAYADHEDDIALRMSMNPTSVFGPFVKSLSHDMLFSMLKPGTRMTAYVAPLYGENYDYDTDVVLRRNYEKLVFIRPETWNNIKKYGTEEDLQADYGLKTPTDAILVMHDNGSVVPIMKGRGGDDESYIGYGHEPLVYTWVKQQRCPAGSRRDKTTGECKATGAPKQKRCPAGSRRDKTTGECVSI